MNFVESVESPESEQIVLKINALQKSRKLVLKIDPIEGVKFGGAREMSYLCIGFRTDVHRIETGPVSLHELKLTIHCENRLHLSHSNKLDGIRFALSLQR